MSYLLDTCALSELRKHVPLTVKNWFEDIDQDLFFISVITIAELLDGIERLSSSKKKKDLENWFFGEVYTRFKDRILPIDDHIAKEWAIITLNVKDFYHTKIPIINPWA